MVDKSPDTSSRARGRSRATRIRHRKNPRVRRSPKAPISGAFKPLSENQVKQVLDNACHVLEMIGMGVIGEIPPAAKQMLEDGARLNDRGRILIPRPMVEDALAITPSCWTLHGLDPERSIQIEPGHPHFGTAGGAVMMLDSDTGKYRETSLRDVYDMARLVDTLPNIHWCYRSPIARDMATAELLDINTAYALLRGTTMPIGLSLASVENVKTVTKMFDLILGHEGRFKQTPIAHIVQGAGVPPLRFAYERCIIKEEAIRQGFPVMIASAPQAGATAPAALLGSVVQSTAEVLAGIVYANTVSPGCPLTFAAWPFVSDLRSGAMTGGSGEQALLMSAVTQVANYLNIPSSVAAGMTDSKLPDAQSGYEKGTSITLAGHAGASMIHESAGMHASLMGCSLESYVIDNEMLGNINRTIKGIGFSESLLSLDTISDVNVDGAGHYLGEAQTLNLMESEYIYPVLGDRQTISEWEEDGSQDILDRARNYTSRILSTHFPQHISTKTDDKIRASFDIRLSKKAVGRK
ncbi:MAG: methyltransferase [Gammaproteobacteria bacterium]|nr:methyltransferase [Gammaproteobacteria bacterium]MCP4978906.1 methyltransferase [Gammaproteobacteria bacterium]